MKGLHYFLGCVCLIAVSQVWAYPVQWRPEDGGNGHWYELRNPWPIFPYDNPGKTDWDHAKMQAQWMSHYEIPGHLATITSESENNFIKNNIIEPPDSPWIGGYQRAGSPEPAGGWTWTTGEPWNYTNWSSGEPNDFNDENALQFSWDQGWNDVNNETLLDCYVVEYEMKMYWADRTANKVQSSDLNGAYIEDSVVGLNGPTGIEVDRGKIYWSDAGTGTIRRADVDGSDVEIIVAELHNPNGIAIDHAYGKIYWSSPFLHKIQRADLDGSDVEDVVSGLNDPYGVAVGPGPTRKIYWTDSTARKVQRANPDGTNIEDVYTGLSEPQGIELDQVTGNIYWADPVDDKIYCSGTALPIEGLQDPMDVALDLMHGKIYWTERTAGRIRRANLDGSGVEEVVTGLSNPQGLVIPEPATLGLLLFGVLAMLRRGNRRV